MLVAAGLSTGNKVGLAFVAGLFILFALLSAFVFPRYWPDYPGRIGLPVFIAATIALFLGMMAAVLVFGRESEEAEAGHETTTEQTETTAPTTTTSETTAPTTTAPATTKEEPTERKVAVTETEFKIKLEETSFSPGRYDFVLTNEGKIPHDLAIKGPGVDNEKTPEIDGGKSADLHTELRKGTYELYCSVPGHKQLGMDLKITVA